MSSPNPSPVKLGPTYGAELLATCFAVALWGMACMQTFIYYIQYPKDRLTLRALVLWLWVANTVHEILIVKGVYDSQIIGFCDYNRISTVVPEFLWQILCTALVSISAQTFFTYRIWIFSGRPWFYWAILVPICLLELAGSLAVIALATITPTSEEMIRPPTSGLFTAVQVVSATADLTISAGLIILLIKSCNHIHRGSRSILQKLLLLTVNTGIWTALFAVFTFISILAFSSTLVYAALYFPLCPLYCNTVLANLNARDYILGHSAATEGGTVDQRGPVFIHQGSTFTTQTMDPKLTVQVDVDKSVSRDDDDDSPLRAEGSKSDLERQ